MGRPEAEYQLGVICWKEGDYAQSVRYLTVPAGFPIMN